MEQKKQGDGLTNFEIQQIATTQGIPVDAILPENKIPEISKIIEQRKGKRFHAFIINTATRGEPQTQQHHWYALLFDTKPGAESVELFNSLGADNQEGIIEEKLAEFLDQNSRKIFPDAFPVLKINRIKVQRDDQDNCGQFALNFIHDRINLGKSFKQATDFSKLDKKKRRLMKDADPFPVYIDA